MDNATRQLCRDEAIRSLESYQRTGLAGFLQKGLDRARALGIDYALCGNVPALILRLQIGDEQS